MDNDDDPMGVEGQPELIVIIVWPVAELHHVDSLAVRLKSGDTGEEVA